MTTGVTPTVSMKSNRSAYAVWLAFCVLLAFALRTYRLDLQSLWYDEGVTAEIARRPLGALVQWTAQDIQPPLYYLTVSGWGKMLQALAPTSGSADLPIPERWGGAWSEWSLRYLSAIFGTLTVPLLATLSTGLSGHRAAGAFAGLLAALHPLLFYYSQEARMYALLAFLGGLAGYLLLCRCVPVVPLRGKPPHRWRWWGLYVAIATAAVYTHYFAFFLLGALALSFLLRRWLLSSSANATLKGGAFVFKDIGVLVIVHLLILFLYLPWFSILFAQLQNDTSYWQGEFKLAEALPKVLISFVGGETVSESVGRWLLLPFGLFTLIAILALVWPAADGKGGSERERVKVQVPNSILLTALLWSIVPVGAIHILALFIPKFNPRYGILGLPGLILLWSAGLARLWILFGQRSHGPVSVSTPVRSAGLLVAFMLLLTATSAFIYADRNYFVDPEFTKTQWEPLARYVRKRAQPGDLVVLTSGHSWPIWNYYAPSVPARGLPAMRVLDVNKVIDYREAASQLRALLGSSERAWLVSWQDEVVDPMDAVPIFLERAAREVPRERDYWDVDVRRFQQVQVSEIEPDLGREVSLNFGNQLVLKGYQVHVTGELLLYWQRHAAYRPPVSDLDLRLAGYLETNEGLRYHAFNDQALTVHDWPSSRWREEMVVVSRVPAPAWAGSGAMPGDYQLALSLYDPLGDLAGYDLVASDGQPVGKLASLPITLSRPVPGSPATPAEMTARIWPHLYIDANTERASAEPGQPFALSINWLATEGISQTAAVENPVLQLSWRTGEGEIVEQTKHLLASGYPVSRWPENERLRTLHEVRTGEELEPGPYQLWITLKSPTSSPLFEQPLAATLPFQILPSTRTFHLPQMETSVDAEFGEQIALRGLIEDVEVEKMSNAVTFQLVWQAIASPARDFSVTVQVLDELGVSQSQTDSELPDGSSNWMPGQVEVQPISLPVPDFAPTYRIIVALYDAEREGLPRLRLPDGSDHVTLPLTFHVKS